MCLSKCLKNLTPFSILMLATLASAVSLAAALISQYVYHLTPCELCIFQRIPYAVILLLGVLGLLRRKWAKGLAMLAVLAFLIDGGIAFYHAGVEQHWFPGPDACTDQGGAQELTVEQILEKLKAAPIVACDQPQWDFHGITMAAMNAVWAFGLAVVSFAALRKIRKPGQGDA